MWQPCDFIHRSVCRFLTFTCTCTDYALGKDCIMHGYMLKLGNPFLTQWQRRYFYLFPNRVEWRGEGESRVSSCNKPFTKTSFYLHHDCYSALLICLSVNTCLSVCSFPLTKGFLAKTIKKVKRWGECCTSQVPLCPQHLLELFTDSLLQSL